MAATKVIALDLAEASVKVRDGGPGDEESDVAANAVWAGVLPVTRSFGTPQPAADLRGEWDVPEHVTRR